MGSKPLCLTSYGVIADAVLGKRNYSAKGYVALQSGLCGLSGQLRQPGVQIPLGPVESLVAL